MEHWYINPNEKSNKIQIFSSELTYQRLNIPLRHLINAKTQFMSWQRSAVNEVNDWAPSVISRKSCYGTVFGTNRMAKRVKFFNVYIIIHFSKTLDIFYTEKILQDKIF